MSGNSLSDSDVNLIKDTIESWTECLEDGYIDTWATYWAKDGVLMPPGHPQVEGRQRLVEFIQENFGKVRTIALSDWNVDG